MCTTYHRNEVDQLIDRILDPTRRDALVLVSVASDTNQPRIDLTELVDATTDLPCHIALLATPEASLALSDTTHGRIQCYGGAVRILLPGATLQDHPYRHPTFTTFPPLDDPHETIQRIARRLERLEWATTTPTPARHLDIQAKPLPHIPKPGAWLNTPAPPSQPQPPAPHHSDPPTIPDPTDSTEAPTSPSDLTELTAELAALRQTLTQLPHLVETIVTAALTDLFGAGDETAQRQRAEAAEERINELTSALLDQRPDTHAHVYTDPTQQLAWEIEQRWLTRDPEPERKPRQPYTLAPGFLADLERGLVPRARVVDVVCDILTGQVWDRRICHQLHDAPRGGNPIVRADGAVMWRVYLKTESPGAPRLHFWQLADSVDLVHIGHHDQLPSIW